MKKIIALLIVFLISHELTFSQKTDKEVAKKYTKDDLRKFEEQKKKRDEVFNSDDPDFKTREIPEKWNKESAVVLCQKYYFNYDHTGGSVVSAGYIILNELVRRRVKLLDKAAVDEFSEFYYTNANITGFRVIKQDGSSSDVDPRNAVEVKTGVTIPKFFRSFNYSASYKKIAIPGLEAGDIIDYFYQSTDRMLTESISRQYNYAPVVFTLSASYPVLKQKYEFIVDKNFFISFKSFHGAPALKQTEASFISADKVSKKAKAYVLEDINREKSAEERWTYEFLSDPMIKFQVYFVQRKYTDNCYDFIGKSTEARSEVPSGEEVKDLVKRYLNEYSVASLSVNQALAWIKKNRKDVTDPREKAILGYYYWRYSFDYSRYNYSSQSNEDVEGPNSWGFISFMAELMRGLGHSAETDIIVVVPRTLGDINTLLLSAELNYGIRVGGSTGIMLFPFTRYTTHDYIDPDHMGMEAYYFSADKRKKDEPVKKMTIPSSGPEKNQMNADVHVKLTEEMELVNVKRTTTYTGLLKLPYSPLALYTDDFRSQESKMYDPAYRELPRTVLKKDIPEYNRKKEERLAEKIKLQKEVLKKEVENEFEVESYDSYKLLKAGRERETPELSFEENFTLKGIINKAGRNYSLDVGKLIGSQIKIEEKEKKREHDIYCNYPRKLVNNISFELPQGYTPENISDLEMKIDNEAGTFESTAKFENGLLVVTTSKIYKSNFSSKDKWQLWIDFLDSAYNYSQKKVILKKT